MKSSCSGYAQLAVVFPLVVVSPRYFANQIGLGGLMQVANLITDPAGAGKSVLLRAIAGIWPFGRGQIRLGEGRTLFVPQLPYLPPGTLASALLYPLGDESSFSKERLAAVLEDVGLGALAGELVHLTINLTPVLLRQIEDYVERGFTDRALELTRTPTPELRGEDRDEIAKTFFDADWHNEITLIRATKHRSCADTALTKVRPLQSTKNARLFLAHRENSSRYWSWVNFVGILLGVENNSVQNEMLTRKGSFQSCSRNL